MLDKCPGSCIMVYMRNDLYVVVGWTEGVTGCRCDEQVPESVKAFKDRTMAELYAKEVIGQAFGAQVIHYSFIHNL